MSNKKTKQNNKKKELGAFYTPETVVDFIYDILNILKEKEDKENQRWESRKSRSHYPSVIDPACGEGIFLKKAVESGYTGYHPSYDIPYVFGIDIDKSVVDQWEEISILNLFNGKREAMRDHFYHQNGLSKLPDKSLRYKKGRDKLDKFDAVVGNPPYGGTGLKKSEIKDKLANSLFKYEIWSYAFGWAQSKQETMFGANIKDRIAKKIKKFPIEILFIERFIQLAKDPIPEENKEGGKIAIIIPDGILANSTYHYVRQFIADKTKVLGIVSLPRDTFKQVGTSAKTSILFLQKEERNDLNYPVFLASIKKLEKEYLKKISNSFNNFYNYGKI